mmetsp:Transcript_9592/g.21214  ORF Transcript_9592/g.21214 Transcript_9592/m.21214 type:complete len:427 (+) Transcript_9592:582-1862(+)
MNTRKQLICSSLNSSRLMSAVRVAASAIAKNMLILHSGLLSLKVMDRTNISKVSMVTLSGPPRRKHAQTQPAALRLTNASSSRSINLNHFSTSKARLRLLKTEEEASRPNATSLQLSRRRIASGGNVLTKPGKTLDIGLTPKWSPNTGLAVSAPWTHRLATAPRHARCSGTSVFSACTTLSRLTWPFTSRMAWQSSLECQPRYPNTIAKHSQSGNKCSSPSWALMSSSSNRLTSTSILAFSRMGTYSLPGRVVELTGSWSSRASSSSQALNRLASANVNSFSSFKRQTIGGKRSFMPPGATWRKVLAASGHSLARQRWPSADTPPPWFAPMPGWATQHIRTAASGPQCPSESRRRHTPKCMPSTRSANSAMARAPSSVSLALDRWRMVDLAIVLIPSAPNTACNAGTLKQHRDIAASPASWITVLG